jgi:hypothetical protein
VPAAPAALDDDDESPADAAEAQPAASGKIKLDAAERQKLADLAAVVSTNGQELLVGWNVKVFGKRQPQEADEDYSSTAHKAWSALWERWIGPREASPWGIIAVTSVGMAIQMYAGGTPLPPKEIAATETVVGRAPAPAPTREYKFREYAEDDVTS